MNFYKHHLGDYDGATSHLDWLEDMAYTRLLRVYYRREIPIPSDISLACRLIRASGALQRKSTETVLREFFILESDGWHNKRCDEEIAAYQRRASTNRRIAQTKVGQPIVDESLTNGTPNHKPDTKNHKPVKTTPAAFALPDWVPLEPWSAWLEVRTKVRAPNTPRALAIAIKSLEELRDAGYDPKSVLDLATVRGWRGLFPPKADGQGAKGNGAGPPWWSSNEGIQSFSS